MLVAGAQTPTGEEVVSSMRIAGSSLLGMDSQHSFRPAARRPLVLGGS
jgi:hypothetical protein